MKKKLVTTGGAALFVFLGLIYAWSIFSAPLELEFGWSRAQTSLTFTICMSCFCVGGLLASKLKQIIKPRYIMVLGGGIIAAGFFLTSYATSLWQLYFFYGVFCGFAVGMCYNCLLSVLPLWHPKRVGFINGAMLMIYGFGSLILGNPITAVINVMGWCMAFKVLALVFLILFMLLSVLIQAPDTVAAGALNHGATDALSEALDHGASAVSVHDVSTVDMLKTRSFWLFFIWECMVGAVGLALIGHAAAIASDMYTPAALMAVAVGSVSAASGVGRLLCGILSDAFGDVKTAILMNLMGMAGCALLLLCQKTPGMPLLFCGFILCGMCFGAGPALNASYVRHTFGDKYFSTNFSIMSFSLLFSSVAGTYLVGLLRSASTSYMSSFLLILAYLFVGLISLGVLSRGQAEQMQVKVELNV